MSIPYKPRSKAEYLRSALAHIAELEARERRVKAWIAEKRDAAMRSKDSRYAMTMQQLAWEVEELLKWESTLRYGRRGAARKAALRRHDGDES